MTELFLVARAAGQSIAVAANEAQSVISLGTVTAVPHTPDHVAGMASLRSQLLTVIDCDRAFGGSQDQADRQANIAIIVERGGHLYALLVDEVAEIAAATAPMTPIPQHVDSRWTALAKGMVETSSGMMLVIDIDTVITGLISN